MRLKRLVLYFLYIGFTLAIAVLLVGYKTGALAALGYDSLQWSSERNFGMLSHALLAVGAPASPYKGIEEWSYFAVLRDTPLHFAAERGDLSLAKNLLDNGASVNWCCCECITPLSKAITNNQLEMAKLLLQAGGETGRFTDAIELAESKGSSEMIALISAHNKSKQLSLPIE